MGWTLPHQLLIVQNALQPDLMEEGEGIFALEIPSLCQVAQDWPTHILCDFFPKYMSLKNKLHNKMKENEICSFRQRYEFQPLPLLAMCVLIW